MTKIVYNACYGGFSLSAAGMRRYAEIKGLTLYPEPYEHAPNLGNEYHLVPKEQRTGNNKSHDETLYDGDISRSDPALVQTVEELGAAANGQFADLRIRDVPPGTRYRIDEYDGIESVMTVEDYDWSQA